MSRAGISCRILQFSPNKSKKAQAERPSFCTHAALPQQQTFFQKSIKKQALISERLLKILYSFL
jgi:hypothetical protein